MDTSGTASRVVDKATGNRAMTSSSSSSSGPSSSSSSKAFEFANESELKEAIGDVRKGNLDWMLTTYEGGNSNTVILAGKGNGGMEELIALLNDDVVGYGIIRKTEKIDMTEAVKFAYIRFVGDNVPRMLKARLGTHSGKITELFHPYHVSLDVTRKDELSDDIVMRTIQSASGTKINVLENDNSRNQPSNSVVTGQRVPQKATSTNTTKVPSAPKQQESAVKFADKESLLQDIKDVRFGNADWCLIGYEGKKGNTLVTLGKGNGGVSELVEKLEDDFAAYGFVRKTDKIDESLTTKFAFITFLGERTDRMHKARLGTHKGAVTDLFAPYSVDLSATSKDEISDEVILNKIQENSGTKSKVLASKS